MPSKFTKSTDAQHKITLESSIISAAWSITFAHGGAAAPLDVLTAFVGEGAKIKIKCKNEKGKTLGKISDVIHGNRFAGKIDLPDSLKIGDMIYFEAELPGLGLKEESNHIAAGPPIKVSKMKWDKKEARRGDILKLSADLTNVPEGSEVKVIIFEHDADGIHDKIVEIPTTVKNKKIELFWEYEYHEDTDEIPTQAELQKYGKSYNPPEYFFVIEIDGQRHGEKQESGLLTFKDYIEIELKSETGGVIANEKYILHLADGSQRQGKLDAFGHAREENIPPGEAKVEFPDLKDTVITF
jgi:hypothetical protein